MLTLASADDMFAFQGRYFVLGIGIGFSYVMNFLHQLHQLLWFIAPLLGAAIIQSGVENADWPRVAELCRRWGCTVRIVAVVTAAIGVGIGEHGTAGESDLGITMPPSMPDGIVVERTSETHHVAAIPLIITNKNQWYHTGRISVTTVDSGGAPPFEEIKKGLSPGGIWDITVRIHFDAPNQGEWECRQVTITAKLETDGEGSRKEVLREVLYASKRNVSTRNCRDALKALSVPILGGAVKDYSKQSKLARQLGLKSRGSV